MKLKIILIAIVIIAMCPTFTYAFFTNTQVSSGHSLSAGTLKTKIEPESPPTIERDITFGSNVSFSFQLTNIGTIKTVNSLSLSKITNKDFASLIQVIVTLNGTQIYAGSLDKFKAEKYLEQSVGQNNLVTFSFSISQENYNNTARQETEFQIESHSGQIELPYEVGFYDKNHIDVKLRNPSLTILTVTMLEEEPRLEFEVEFEKEKQENEEGEILEKNNPEAKSEEDEPTIVSEENPEKDDTGDIELSEEDKFEETENV